MLQAPPPIQASISLPSKTPILNTGQATGSHRLCTCPRGLCIALATHHTSDRQYQSGKAMPLDPGHPKQ